MKITRRRHRSLLTECIRLICGGISVPPKEKPPYIFGSEKLIIDIKIVLVTKAETAPIAPMRGSVVSTRDSLYDCSLYEIKYR